MHTEIKTFEDACKVLKLDPAAVLPAATGYPEKHRGAILAHAKLIIIAEALNGGWTPNWDNYDQRKYYPWFAVGGGFVCDDYVFCNASSCVGSRLCFKSSEIARYAGEQFIDLYKAYFTI